jgi:hypothetical protein
VQGVEQPAELGGDLRCSLGARVGGHVDQRNAGQVLVSEAARPALPRSRKINP